MPIVTASICWRLLTKVRQKVAMAKVKATTEYVQGAIEQGEKAIVFTGFDAPAKELQKAFGDEAVLLTGSTLPTADKSWLTAFKMIPM